MRFAVSAFVSPEQTPFQRKSGSWSKTGELQQGQAQNKNRGTDDGDRPLRERASSPEIAELRIMLCGIHAIRDRRNPSITQYCGLRLIHC